MEATQNKENAIINFVYFCFNFPSDFINEAFKEKPKHLQEHLKSKFESYNRKDTRSAVIRFFTELDTENQKILINWIDNNYKAFKHL